MNKIKKLEYVEMKRVNKERWWLTLPKCTQF